MISWHGILGRGKIAQKHLGTDPTPPGLTCPPPVFAEVVGVGCVLDGVRYTNGESFQPNCRYNCTCIDGTVGCTPLCLSPRPPRLWCRQPRHVRVPGQCCEQWVCDDDARRPRQTALLDTRAFGKCGQRRAESLHTTEPLESWFSFNKSSFQAITHSTTHQLYGLQDVLSGIQILHL